MAKQAPGEGKSQIGRLAHMPRNLRGIFEIRTGFASLDRALCGSVRRSGAFSCRLCMCMRVRISGSQMAFCFGDVFGV